MFSGGVAYYGLYKYTDNYEQGTTPTVFSIFKIIEDENIHDKRKKSRGLNCVSFTGKDRLEELSYIMTSLGIEQKSKRNLKQKCSAIHHVMEEKGLLLLDINM